MILVNWAMPRAYSVDLRERALQALASGRSVAEVAQLFGVGRKTVYRWQSLHTRTGSLTPGHSPGRPHRLSAQQEVALVAQVEGDPDLTLAELCATAPVSVSPTTMGRLLRRHGLTRKKRP